MKREICLAIVVAMAGCNKESKADSAAAQPAAAPTSAPAPAAAPEAPAAQAAPEAQGTERTRIAFHDAAAALQAVATSTAKTPNELCDAGRAAVKRAESLVSTLPPLPIPAGVEAKWNDLYGAFTMNLGAFDGQFCKEAKKDDMPAIKDALSDLVKQAKQLEAMAAKK